MGIHGSVLQIIHVWREISFRLYLLLCTPGFLHSNLKMFSSSEKFACAPSKTRSLTPSQLVGFKIILRNTAFCQNNHFSSFWGRSLLSFPSRFGFPQEHCYRFPFRLLPEILAHCLEIPMSCFGSENWRLLLWISTFVFEIFIDFIERVDLKYVFALDVNVTFAELLVRMGHYMYIFSPWVGRKREQDEGNQRTHIADLV